MLIMKLIMKFLAAFFLLLVLAYFFRQRWLLNLPQLLPSKATVSGSSSLLRGSYYEVSIPPTKEAKYKSAKYRLWVPDGVKTLRGLIVKQHGCGDAAAASGLEHANDLQWQTLALKHQFALLGTEILNGDRPCEYWALINYGSGEAFLKALDAFAKKSQHAELTEVPWALWGHSGGADWVAQMLQQYPERTIAVVAVRGGGFPLLGTNPTLAGIPVLFASGEKDPYASETLELPKQVFLRYRKINAVWAFAIEANTAHESGDTRFLAIPYLDAAIGDRLASDSNQLNLVKADRGWLGNTGTHMIAPINLYEGNPLEAVWLPNEETARKWQKYVKTGKIPATRKPAAPTNLSVTRIGTTEALLTWKYIPDLENGLPSFRIYRNSSLIQTLKGQEHNFGDAAEPPNVVLEFRDKNATLNSIYTVTAFNDLGEMVAHSNQPIEQK
jgi:pimeloyl-ACP methyl ester carboxylesterase